METLRQHAFERASLPTRQIARWGTHGSGRQPSAGRRLSAPSSHEKEPNLDESRFDNLTRGLAGSHSRRRVIRGLGGGLAAAALGAAGLRRSAGAAPEEKVTICHWDADLSAFQQITISYNG